MRSLTYTPHKSKEDKKASTFHSTECEEPGMYGKKHLIIQSRLQRRDITEAQSFLYTVSLALQLAAYVSIRQHVAYVKEAMDLSIRQQQRRDAVDAYYCVIA